MQYYINSVQRLLHGLRTNATILHISLPFKRPCSASTIPPSDKVHTLRTGCFEAFPPHGKVETGPIATKVRVSEVFIKVEPGAGANNLIFPVSATAPSGNISDLHPRLKVVMKLSKVLILSSRTYNKLVQVWIQILCTWHMHSTGSS
jgi:hypothetical protein